ncbi:MAG: ferritin-like domain-containing protein [Bryobacteraceae bacterium]
MASASTKDYISALNDLIETCKDGEEGYRKAAESVKRSDLQSLFNEYSRQRSQFASELQMEVSRIGGEPEKSGSVSGAVHRGWIDVKSAVTGKDDHAVLEEAERGEDNAKKNYQDALGKDLPIDLRSMVERQYSQVQQSHNRIRSLRDNTEEKATYKSSSTML